MDERTGLTRTEVVVIIAVVAFIALIVIVLGIGAAIFMPELQKPMEQHKRIVCTANLRDLGIAWIIYANDNDGKLVNGQPSVNADGTLDPADNRPTAGNRIEIPWARGIEIDTDTGDPKIPKHNQELLIKEGALWPYIKNTKGYRCPGGKAKHLRTYSIVCSLNGDISPVSTLPNKSMLRIKNKSLARRPHERIVFVDEGWVNNLSFRVGYSKPGAWIDPPPVRHRGGMTFVFADGHGGYWKWKGEETIKLGESAGPTQISQHVEPKTVEGKEDLQKMQRAVWGELGYTPSVSD